MFTNVRSVGLTLLALGFLMASASAQSFSIQGSVKGSSGKSLSGGDVRVERVDAKSPTINAKTDGKGHYSLNGLQPGTYKITVYENSAPKSSGVVKTRKDGYLRVDFDLAAKDSHIKVKRYIWVATQTGTLFSGKWVEADETGPGFNPVETMNNQGAQQLSNSHGSGKSGN